MGYKATIRRPGAGGQLGHVTFYNQMKSFYSAGVFLFGDTTDKHQLYELHPLSLSYPHHTHGIMIKVNVIIVTFHRIRYYLNY